MEKKRTAPYVAEARRELGQKTVSEYAKLRRPRQRRMTEYSTGGHVDSSINVHVIPRLGSRKLNGARRSSWNVSWTSWRLMGSVGKSDQHLPHTQDDSE
jgi:hypothetical protein